MYAKVQPGASYSGAKDDPLTQAIITHRTARGGTQDGHASVIRGTGVYDGKTTFMLIAINTNIMDFLTRDYPRLDKHGRCPAALRAAVARCFTF